MVKKRVTHRDIIEAAKADLDHLHEHIAGIETVQNALIEERWPGILHMARVQAAAETLCDLLGNPLAKKFTVGRIEGIRDRDAERGNRFDGFNWEANLRDALNYSYEHGAERDDEVAITALRSVYPETSFEEEPS